MTEYEPVTEGIITKGSPIRLIVDTEHFPKGTVGIANTVVHVDKTYAWFMPSTEFGIYVMDIDNFELISDEEAAALGVDGLLPEGAQELITTETNVSL